MPRLPNADQIYKYISCLPWTGHVELPDHDQKWLSLEIERFIKHPHHDILFCEYCESARPLVINTRLGYICSECIEELSEAAEEAREELEG